VSLYPAKTYSANWRDNAAPALSSRKVQWFQSQEPKIVVIGGGSGSAIVLRGLKQRTANLTAIVTMFDSGGSSGRLRHEFGCPPFGDLRQCLLALSAESDFATLPALLGFRFSETSSLKGHSLGNLILAALTTLSNNIETAIDELSRLLRIRGQVIPVSLEQADLCAELEDGQILKGETVIDLRGSPSPRISRVFLEPQAAANPRAVQAILEADAVVLGPGDLYTSLLPNLLVEGIPQALNQTRAMLIHVCNLMTKAGETDDFQASDFAREINRYLGGALIDWIVVNTVPMPREIQAEYTRQGARPVEADLARLANWGVKYRQGRFSNSRLPVRHNPVRLADVILSLVNSDWVLEGNWPSTGIEYRAGQAQLTRRKCRGTASPPAD